MRKGSFKHFVSLTSAIIVMKKSEYYFWDLITVHVIVPEMVTAIVFTITMTRITAISFDNWGSYSIRLPCRWYHQADYLSNHLNLGTL